MGEIRIARGALLRAMRLHRKDVSPVQKIFVGLGIVGADPLDELILADHLMSPGIPRGAAATPERRVRDGCRRRTRVGRRRSEEHTSELQSLMRTSYAVFCLKKKHRPSEDIQEC